VDDVLVEQGGLSRDRPSLAYASTVVAIGFLGSRLLGVARTIAIAVGFGTGPDTSAFFVAFRLPDLIFQLVAGATLGSAFIPTFARVLNIEGEERAWRLANSVLNLVFIVTLVLAIAGFLLAPVIVPIMAPGLGSRAEAVELTRIMMLSPILFAASGMFMGILNARHHFLFPALAPMVYNLAIIVGVLVSNDVHGLAIAVVIGAGLHLVVQLPALAGVGMRYAFVADWRDAAVRQVGKLMAPRVLGLAAYQFNFLITIFFASIVSDQAISAVNYAWLIALTPLGLFAMAISTAVFPTMAEQAVTDHVQLRRTLEQSLKLILFLTLPSAVGLMILSRPLVATMFQYGAFTKSSTDLTAPALLFYSMGLVGMAAIEILSRGFYSLQDTRTPVIFALVSLVINLILSAIFVWPFGVSGLALAISLAALVEAALLFVTLRERIAGIDVEAIRRSFMWTGLCTVLMAEAVGVYLVLLHQAGHLDTSRFVDAFLALAGGGAIGAATYVAAARALHVDEVDTLLRRVPVLRDWL
jgi:putative peptidoglycan lipid II flippase